MLVVAVILAVLAVLVVARTREARPVEDSAERPTQPPTTGQAPVPMPQRTPGYDRARTLLTALPVKGWDRNTDYARYRLGDAWSDDVNVEFGHNGCNTRDDILRRDLAQLTVRPGTCYAAGGVLHDPYTGVEIAFTRGPDTSSMVQIDHLVSLSDAWYKGARTWDPQRRKDFANDPRNLLAVAAQPNFDKAFRDAASWLPPNVAFRCEFVARQVEVKAAYQLWVSAKEKHAMAAVLDNC
ncbi:HNH endonuclease [Mycobacterium sp. CBMA247]|nr:HNH endonuclease [Mycolicibacterium sp. CBMA 329]MUL91301.1 HNH endonuclease [Mycolicibacterium sp. CBMA 331]MUM02499.1 HNH endonuclease [Mycolicibacterium sp. CBMA 334]MUM30178.1 HNH endonuclease [Mycolicibacterium sp. CBMA 295]MUM41060.1 HNH endonuclease [Mycolicibacterium sp. CBMA 247]MUM47256.1 HNH endonuclease [Mycolicibacterium sp. CBMA 294]